MSSSYSISLSKDEWAVVGIVLLDQEVSWHVLLILKRNDLSQFRWFTSLSVVNFMSINNDVLSKILISVKTSGMWRRWLVYGPVVEWWVPDWVPGLGLN